MKEDGQTRCKEPVGGQKLQKDGRDVWKAIIEEAKFQTRVEGTQEEEEEEEEEEEVESLLVILSPLKYKIIRIACIIACFYRTLNFFSFLEKIWDWS